MGRPESKQYKGEPFFPVTSVAVDMFPHTSHTEMIILFERRSNEKKQLDEIDGKDLKSQNTSKDSSENSVDGNWNHLNAFDI